MSNRTGVIRINAGAIAAGEFSEKLAAPPADNYRPWTAIVKARRIRIMRVIAQADALSGIAVHFYNHSDALYDHTEQNQGYYGFLEDKQPRESAEQKGGAGSFHIYQMMDYQGIELFVPHLLGENKNKEIGVLVENSGAVDITECYVTVFYDIVHL